MPPLTKPSPNRLSHYTFPIPPSAPQPPNISLNRWFTPLLIPPCSYLSLLVKRTHRISFCEHRRLMFLHIPHPHLLDGCNIQENEVRMGHEHAECEHAKQSRPKGSKTVSSWPSRLYIHIQSDGHDLRNIQICSVPGKHNEPEQGRKRPSTK